MLCAASTHAAGPLGQNGQPIFTSDYHIDLFQGPVLASSRVTGFAGAYAAIAEGVDGYAVSSAAPTVRVPWSYDYIDYDLSVGITFPNALANTDFENKGKSGFAYKDFLFVPLGANVQIGTWGFGFALDLQTYQLGDTGGLTPGFSNLQVALVRAKWLVAKSFIDGQLMFGLGARVAGLTLTAKADTGSSEGKQLFSTTSGGVEAGVMIAPHALPVRGSFTWRGPMKRDSAPDESLRTADGDYVTANHYLPSAVEIPWELELGVALQFGPRPLNPRWHNPHDRTEYTLTPDDKGEPRRLSNEALRKKLRADYAAMARERFTLLFAALVSGSVENGVGFESFLVRTVERSGKNASVTPRIGVEAEVIPGWLQLRSGSYLEPSRYDGVHARLHGTVGLDVKLFRWSVFGLLDEDTSFRIGGFGDVAQRYVAWGLTAGIWH